MILSNIAEEEEVIRWVPPLIAYDETRSLDKRSGIEHPALEDRTTMDQEIENARLIGYQQGLVDGELNGKTTTSSERTELLQLLSSLQSRLTKIDETTQQSLVHFAFELGKTIVRQELQSDQRYYLDLIQRSYEEMSEESPPISITLNPEDIDLITAGTPQADSDVLSLLVGDETLPRGSCLLESPTCYIDAGIDSVIDRIKSEHSARNTIGE